MRFAMLAATPAALTPRSSSREVDLGLPLPLLLLLPLPNPPFDDSTPPG